MCTSHGPTLSRRATLTATLTGGLAAGPAVALAVPAAASGRSRPGHHDQHGHHGHHRGRVRDLTHPLTTDFPVFVPGEEATRRTTTTIEADGYYTQEWTVREHVGTHVDAPGHFVAGARLAPELRAEELVCPAVVVDIADRAAEDPDAEVTVEDLWRFERRHGRIPADAAVLMHSGWARYVEDADAYRNPDSSGTLHFPGFGPEATQWLVRRRRIRCVGVDTLSTDPGRSTSFETHLVLGGADRYGIENLANLDRLPPKGSVVVVGLVPYEEGSGGQARVLAL